VRYYFWRRGEKAILLPGLRGSEEFMAAYAMALAAQPNQPEIGASRTLPGTINALVVDYYRSAEWQVGLGKRTCKVRRGIIERFRTKHGDKRVVLLRRDHIERMLIEIAKPSAKVDWLKAIRGLLRFGKRLTQLMASRLSAPRPRVTTIGPTRRSLGIARIGRLERNRGSSWSLR
jgi:hypothetical protein